MPSYSARSSASPGSALPSGASCSSAAAARPLSSMRRSRSSLVRNPLGATPNEPNSPAQPPSASASTSAADRRRIIVLARLLLQHDDALARTRDCVRQLRVRIAHRLDLLQLESMQEELVADQRLDRPELL